MTIQKPSRLGTSLLSALGLLLTFGGCAIGRQATNDPLDAEAIASTRTTC